MRSFIIIDKLTARFSSLYLLHVIPHGSSTVRLNRLVLFIVALPPCFIWDSFVSRLNDIPIQQAFQFIVLSRTRVLYGITEVIQYSI